METSTTVPGIRPRMTSWRFRVRFSPPWGGGWTVQRRFLLVFWDNVRSFETADDAHAFVDELVRGES